MFSESNAYRVLFVIQSSFILSINMGKIRTIVLLATSTLILAPRASSTSILSTPVNSHGLAEKL